MMQKLRRMEGRLQVGLQGGLDSERESDAGVTEAEPSRENSRETLIV